MPKANCRLILVNKLNREKKVNFINFAMEFYRMPREIKN